MDKGSYVILHGYSKDLKFLNNKIGKIISVDIANGKIVSVRMTFKKPVFQKSPIKAEIVVWCANMGHIKEFKRVPIKVVRTPIFNTKS